MNLTLIIASISVACTIITLAYNMFLVPSRADRKEIEKRLAKLELDDANHDARLTGFSQNMERQNDRWEERCARIEQELSAVSRMREEMASVKAKMEHVVEGYDKLDRKIDKLFDLLRTK